MKILPKLAVSTASGSDPDSIDDAHNVYGDLIFNMDHLEGEHCERSASGVHEYLVIDGIYCCACCGMDGGEV